MVVFWIVFFKLKLRSASFFRSKFYKYILHRCFIRLATLWLCANVLTQFYLIIFGKNNCASTWFCLQRQAATLLCECPLPAALINALRPWLFTLVWSYSFFNNKSSTSSKNPQRTLPLKGFHQNHWKIHDFRHGFQYLLSSFILPTNLSLCGYKL